MPKKCTSNEYEAIYWPQNRQIVGLDEAGRGPLAGPLVVAGVVFPIGYANPDIYDSKGLSEKKREALFEVIKEDALSFEIRIVSPEEIDRLNIYAATQKAMFEIAEKLEADVVLTDAMPLPDHPKEVVSLVKGDQKSVHIAAASILAKVTRDRIMMEYDEIYPEYGFAKHKGYPTREHMEALEKYGVLPIHRKSYGPVRDQLNPKLELF
ncbi:MAG: ribonuclease HII [Erysipelotrichaceae bacterium]|nr:ribonuclease HII [Erysipelotrichaceae bacterium]